MNRFIKLFLFIAIITSICFACTKNQSTSEETKADSTNAVPFKDWEITIVDSLLKDSFPLSSTFIVNNVLPFNENKDGYWAINAFLKIDTLKNMKQYEKYLESMDIGDTKEAQAYIFDTLEFKDQKALLWGISHTSYEACPYYQGRELFITTITGKPATERILQTSLSSDAPVYMNVSGTCKIISSGDIICSDSSKAGGEIEIIDKKEIEEIMINTGKRTYKVDKTGIVLISSIKDPEKKITNSYDVKEEEEGD